MVVKFTVPKRIWSEVSPKTLQRARSHSSCILSFNLIGQHQNKRFYVTGSQTLFFRGREATTGNASAVRMLIDPRTIKIQVFNYATVETFRNHLNLSDLSGNSPQNYECCVMVCLQKNLRIFRFHNTLWMDNRRSVPVLTLKRVRTESVF